MQWIEGGGCERRSSAEDGIETRLFPTLFGKTVLSVCVCRVKFSTLCSIKKIHFDSFKDCGIIIEKYL